jgi:hypothetical protein
MQAKEWHERMVDKENFKLRGKGIIKETWPALIVLSFTFIISVFFTEFTFVSGAKAAWLIILRFFRLSLILMLPLLFLPWIFTLTDYLFHKGSLELIQLEQERNQEISPLKNWILRPLQGIGISMLIATKLIYFLGIYSGKGIEASVIMPPASFSPWRFITTTAMAMMVSLILSFLWALDDLGIRLYNSKTKEIRMIGKYLGLILPVIIGFYGMISLLKDHSMTIAIQYLVQMILILYPPFLVFIVFHAFHINRSEDRLLKRLHVRSQMNL